MRTLLKIIAVFLLVVVIAAIGLNLYFTDDRLKAIVEPKINEAIDRPVTIGNMSLTYFSTFPRPGVTIENFSIQGDTEQDTLLQLQKLALGVKVLSLFGDEIEFSEIELNKPQFTYVVYPDSSTNIDFLLNDEETETQEDTKGVNIPYLEINDGMFGYNDLSSGTHLRLEDVDSEVSLRYSDLIESDFELNIGEVHATVDSTQYLTGLPVSITQESVIDQEGSSAQITAGNLSIKGLTLNVSGEIENWSDTPYLDITFSSDSKDFGELLRLVPEEYESHVANLETEGSLAIEGNVTGNISEDEIPEFNVLVNVSDGYLKNLDLEEPIEDIQLNASFTNELLTVERLNAMAGTNQISGTASLNNPLEETGEFSLDLNGDVDLSTIQSFIDLNEFDIERMDGKLAFNAVANGVRSNPENATFEADISLDNGSLKYAEVSQAIQNINIQANATNTRVNIDRLTLNAAGNSFSANGNIQNPLDEATRTIGIETDLKFDLSTVKEFYPISEDTLRMEGLLTAHANLQGKASKIEESVQSGSINLENGFIEYKEIGKPIRDITLESVLDGNKLTIVNGSFKTGDNDLKVSGLVTDYLSETRTVNLNVQGNAELDELNDYYELDGISSLTGSAALNLNVEGVVQNPETIALNGDLNITNMNVEGDSLPQPVKNLNATLTMAPETATLENLSMNLGSSDINLKGTFRNYSEFFREENERTVVSQISGTLNSTYFNVDELIDWSDDEETEEEMPIHLPNLNTSLTATIDKLIVTGVEMQDFQAKATTTPDEIKLEQASVDMFEGQASGSLVWDVTNPERTNITFNGELDSLRAESFFEEYAILGEKSNFHEYLSGAFSTTVKYSSDLDIYLKPQISASDMAGSFGMTKSRLNGHPIQKVVADFLKTKEFRNVALDAWKSNFEMNDGKLEVKNLSLTSGDIGLELNGINNISNGSINYQVSLLLPARFEKGIASVITQQATDALTRENGTIMVPLRITGNYNNPKVEPDKTVIKPLLEQYLKDKASSTLEDLFGELK